MSFKQTVDRKETLIGRTDAGRVIWPTLRGSIRRADPDGGSPVPYFPGLAGTSLTIAILGDVVAFVVANFVSNDYGAAIALINTLSPLNIKAEDDNGYLRITNLNGGKKNQITIAAGTAAPILGFEIDPVPGSSSYAGEISTTGTGWPQQNNDQLSRLISYNEGMNSIGINRAIAGVATMFDSIVANMDREFAYPKRIDVTVAGGVFTMPPANDLERLYIGNYNVAKPTLDQLDKVITFLDQNDDQVFANNTRVRVQSITYGAVVDDTQSFVSWTAADGKSVFGNSAHWAKTKTTGAITAIKGNILTIPGALFITRAVQPGDTVLISGATNNTPFNHNGDFIVDAVFGESNISIRPKGVSDTQYDMTNTPPASLNITKQVGESYGTATVIVGKYLPFLMPAGRMSFKLNVNPPDGTYRVLVSVGRTLRTLQPDEINLATVYKQFGKQIELGSKLQSINDALVPRIIAAPSPNNLLTQLAEFPAAGVGAHPIRWYLSPTGGYSILANCKFDLVNGFTKDVNNDPAMFMTVAADSIIIGSKKPADNAPWLFFDDVMDIPVNDFTDNGRILVANGITVGDELDNSGDEARVARVRYHARDNDTSHLTEVIRNTRGFREYITADGKTITNNARWDGANWVRDLNATASLKWVYTNNALAQYIYAGALNTFSDSAWTSLEEFRNYQFHDDFTKPITAVTTPNTDIGDYWKTGAATNASVGTILPGVFNEGLMGTLGFSAPMAGAYSTSVNSRFTIQPEARNFVIKFRAKTGNRTHLQTLANEGFFIGIKEANDIPPPTFRQVVGISCGSDDANWKLRLGTSDVFTDLDLLTANNDDMTIFSVERWGNTLSAYINGVLKNFIAFNYTFLQPVLYIVGKGTATGSEEIMQVDYMKMWVADLG